MIAINTLVTVRQIHQDKFRDIMLISDKDELLKFATNELKHNNYITVADMQFSAEYSLDRMLAMAFELTNSIHDNWFNNESINVYDVAKGGCRSTSIGDIIQINGVSHLVAICGFIEIKHK